MIKSKTKYQATKDEITALFQANHLGDVIGVEVLGAGEFNAVYRVSTNTKEYALKIAPPENAGVLTYENKMMESEVFWYEQIAANTDIGIPKVYVKDFTHTILPVHCFIMEFLKGEPLWTLCRKPKEYERAEVQKIQMLTKIHRIHGERYGYRQMGLQDTWYEAIYGMTNQLIRDCEDLGRETADGKRLLKVLEQNREMFRTVPCCMVNFDLWDSNILYRDNQLYWIDPERSFWGDPIADFITLGNGTAIPLSEKQREIDVYNQTAETPIHCSREENIRYAVAVAYLALIEEVEKYVRYEPGEPNYIRNTEDAQKMYEMAWGICL